MALINKTAVKWLLVVAGVIVVAGGVYVYIKMPIATLDMGDGQIIRIYKPFVWEVSCPLYYEVRNGSKVVVPKRLFTRVSPPDHLETLKFSLKKDGHYTEVVETRKPGEVLISYDWNDGVWWP